MRLMQKSSCNLILNHYNGSCQAGKLGRCYYKEFIRQHCAIYSTYLKQTGKIALIMKGQRYDYNL